MNPVQLRRYKNILAFKDPAHQSILAYHSFNQEVAEVSEEFFSLMSPIDFNTSEVPEDNFSLSNQSFEALNELKDWDSEINLQAKSGKLDFGIRSLTININQICNLKCHYCAAGGDGTYGQPTNKISVEKTLPQLKLFIDKLKPEQKFTVTFVGGEPLLHPEAILAIHNYLYEEAKTMNFFPIINLVTNGTLLSGETLKIVRSMKINLTISLDGEKSINDKVRPTKNNTSSTDLILKGLEELKSNRGQILSLSIAAVFNKENSNVLSAYRFFKTLNPDHMDLNFSVSENSLEAQTEFIYQMRLVAAEAWASGGEAELCKIKDFNTYFNILDSQRRLENYCGAGKTYLVVDAKNNLYTCPWEVGTPSEIIGNDKQINDVALSNYSKSLIELNNCQTCWARHLCGGGCMYINKTSTGNKHKKDFLFCERTRSLIQVALMYYKQSRFSADEKGIL